VRAAEVLTSIIEIQSKLETPQVSVEHSLREDEDSDDQEEMKVPD